MAYFGLQGNALSIVLSIVAATAFALQGYDQAVMNGLLTLPTFLHRFPDMKDSQIEGTPRHKPGCVRARELMNPSIS